MPKNGLQVYLFVMNESATLVQSGRPPIRFADVYHSANRTPVSSSEVAWKTKEIGIGLFGSQFGVWREFTKLTNPKELIPEA